MFALQSWINKKNKESKLAHSDGNNFESVVGSWLEQTRRMQSEPPWGFTVAETVPGAEEIITDDALTATTESILSASERLWRDLTLSGEIQAVFSEEGLFQGAHLS